MFSPLLSFPSISFQLRSAKLPWCWQSAGLRALAHQQTGKGLWEGKTDAGHEPACPSDANPLHQAKAEAGQVCPHRSTTEPHALSEHEPHAPSKPTLPVLLAGGSALRRLHRPLPAGKELPYLCRRERAGLPCLSAIGGLPGAYQFIRGQKTLSRRVLRHCERLIRNSPAS